MKFMEDQAVGHVPSRGAGGARGEMFMSLYDRIISNVRPRRFMVLGILALVLWLARSMMSTILFTFIFTFLIIRLVRWIQKLIPIRPTAVVVPLYILIIAGLYSVVTQYVPEIAKQSITLFNTVADFYNSSAFDHNEAMQWALQQLNDLNLNEQLKLGVATIVQYVTSVGGMVVNVLLALILSFFYTIELDSMNRFGHNFLNSAFGWFFQDIKYFADKFINTFGIVIEAQILIAAVNTVITVITLIFMKMPNIPSLGVMVFLLSLVPVAGAIISVVPLSVISYTVGGWQDVVTIIIMIIIIHMLEAYVLNPKFMSSRTKLPIFFTFVVLLVAEHMWGTWGLIVGLPVFTFLLDILDVKKIPAPTIKRRVHKQDV